MCTFWKIFAHIWEIYSWKFERFIKNALTRSIFELEKCSFFFKWVRILPEIDWYHYQAPSPAPTGIVRLQTWTKTPTRWSVTSEPSVPPLISICQRMSAFPHYCADAILKYPRIDGLLNNGVILPTLFDSKWRRNPANIIHLEALFCFQVFSWILKVTTDCRLSLVITLKSWP